jgi:hypothetical protein
VPIKKGLWDGVASDHKGSNVTHVFGAAIVKHGQGTSKKFKLKKSSASTGTSNSSSHLRAEKNFLNAYARKVIKP